MFYINLKHKYENKKVLHVTYQLFVAFGPRDQLDKSQDFYRLRSIASYKTVLRDASKLIHIELGHVSIMLDN